jgi:hypothetical protein
MICITTLPTPALEDRHLAQHLVTVINPFPENITRVIYRTVPGLLYERGQKQMGNSIVTTLVVMIIITTPPRRFRRGVG